MLTCVMYTFMYYDYRLFAFPRPCAGYQIEAVTRARVTCQAGTHARYTCYVTNCNWQRQSWHFVFECALGECWEWKTARKSASQRYFQYSQTPFNPQIYWSIYNVNLYQHIFHQKLEIIHLKPTECLLKSSSNWDEVIRFQDWLCWEVELSSFVKILSNAPTAAILFIFKLRTFEVTDDLLKKEHHTVLEK